MRVIKDGGIVDDTWQWITAPGAADALPDGDIIVPYRYWLEQHEQLAQRQGKTAICVNGDDEVEEVAQVIDAFDLIALEFPKFRDGRCYSHARLLRERYGYHGELRAVGDVMRDQLFFMRRCGIDSYAVKEGKDIEDALKGFAEFSVRYQTATDGAPPIYRLR